MAAAPHNALAARGWDSMGVAGCTGAVPCGSVPATTAAVQLRACVRARQVVVITSA